MSTLLNNVWLILGILSILIGGACAAGKGIWMMAQFFIGMRNDINLILNNHLVHLQADIHSIKKHIGMAE